MLNASLVIQDKSLSEMTETILRKLDSLQVTGIFHSFNELLKFEEKLTDTDLVYSDISEFPIDDAKADLLHKIPFVYLSKDQTSLLLTLPNNCIDIVELPYTIQKLEKSVQKWIVLGNFFVQKQDHELLYHSKPKKQRLVVKKGAEFFALDIEHIVYFYTKDKLVYALTQTGQKYIYEKTLTVLQEELKGFLFFRANRQYLVNIDFIKSFKTFNKVRIELSMDMDTPQKIIVSQDNTTLFRKWIDRNYY